jgi:hypothetical protein
MFVHPECTNSGLRPPGDFPKAFVCQRVHGSCHLLRFLGLCLSPTMFAFYSLDVKLVYPVGFHHGFPQNAARILIFFGVRM